jgi:hypothetical protein
MSKKNTTKTTKTSRTVKPTLSKGLGDDIEKITKATGIKKVVDTFAELTGIDCGCDARKAKLNKLFPKKTQPLCLEEGEYTTLKEFFKEFNGRELRPRYHEALSRIHSRVFQHKFYIPCTCNPKEWKRHIDDLSKVYGEYESK